MQHPPTRTIGWNGITLDIPSSYEDIVSGPHHLLFEQDFMPVLEIRWQPGKFSSTPTAESLIAGINKQTKGNWSKVKLPALVKKAVSWSNPVGLARPGEEELSALILFCTSSATVVFCHIYPHPALDIATMAGILGSISCHAAPEETTLFAVQDIQLTVPASCTLKDFAFGAGFSRLSFTRKDQTFHAIRLAPADDKLAGRHPTEILVTLDEKLGDATHQSREVDGWNEMFNTPPLKSQVLQRLKRITPFSRGRIFHDKTNDRLLVVIFESKKPISGEDLQPLCDSYEIIPPRPSSK